MGEQFLLQEEMELQRAMQNGLQWCCTQGKGAGTLPLCMQTQ